ncbi:MAG: hypothetical protein WAU58_20340 [Terriglobales bacterium]
MPGNSVAKTDHAMGGAAARLRAGVGAGHRKGVGIAAAVALLACFGVGDLRASQPGMVSSGPVIQRFVRAVPRKYVILPSGATVAVNQVQHFGVMDADGKPVAVRWNVSGLGCYGASCGSIDERGVYHPPSSVPKPRVVTLEGVVIADPHYSVLTQIQLEDAATPNDGPKLAETSVDNLQLPAPQVPNEQSIASRHESMPLPGAVAATPGLEKLDSVRSAELIPLPSVVGAAPSLASQGTARRSELPAVPAAIGATPSVSGSNGSRNADLAPLPRVVVAAPTITNNGVGRHSELPAVPAAVAATPAVRGGKAERTAELVLSPTVVITAPKAPAQPVASPSTARQAEIRSKPAAVPAAPAVDGREPVRIASLLPLPSAALAPGAPSLTSKIQPSLVPEKPLISASQALQTAPSATGPAAVQSTSVESKSEDGTRVVYRNGQLTIDAHNATLADVLKLVAEKTGATIDVPPGSATEAIVEHAGPGMPNDVLTQLLNGSHFNFIIVNSTQNPQELAQVLLSVRPVDTGVAALAPAPTPLTPAVIYKPDPVLAAQPLPPRYDTSLQAPSEKMTPESLGELMKEKAKELRERNQQQYPSQQPQQ